MIFEVKFPSISDTEALIQDELRSLVPLELTDDLLEKASDKFRTELKGFFDKLPEKNSDWISPQLRNKLLLKINTQLKIHKFRNRRNNF